MTLLWDIHTGIDESRCSSFLIDDCTDWRISSAIVLASQDVWARFRHVQVNGGIRHLVPLHHAGRSRAFPPVEITLAKGWGSVLVFGIWWRGDRWAINSSVPLLKRTSFECVDFASSHDKPTC